MATDNGQLEIQGAQELWPGRAWAEYLDRLERGMNGETVEWPGLSGFVNSGYSELAEQEQGDDGN